MKQQQLEQLSVKNSSAIAAGASPVSVFDNPEFGSVRVVMNEKGEPLFCLKDVASCLGYVDQAQAVRDRCDKSCVVEITTQHISGSKQAKFGPESEVYRLIFGSKLESAKKFQDWVFCEVLPSIRKTGSYSTTPKTYIDALKALVASEEEKERLALENKQQAIQIEEDRPKVDAYDDMQNTEGWLTFSEAAKTIFGKYSDQGRNQLFEYCRKHGYIRPGSTEPYQQYVNLGWFKVVVVKKYNKNKVRTYNKTLMSPIGFSNIYQQIRAEVIDRFLFEL